MRAHRLELRILEEFINKEDFELLFNKIGEIVEQYVPSDCYFMSADFSSEKNLD